MGRMCRDAAWLNADGVLLEENRKAFLARKESLGPAVLTGPYRTGFDESGWVQNNIDAWGHCANCHRELVHGRAACRAP